MLSEYLTHTFVGWTGQNIELFTHYSSASAKMAPDARTSDVVISGVHLYHDMYVCIVDWIWKLC